MTEPRLTDLACRAFAAFVHELRPDFDAAGVVAALRAEREYYDPWQLAAAMCKRAADPANTTPRLQPFDREGFIACRRHPGAPVRTSGVCGFCHSEANGAEYEPRPARDPQAPAHPLEDALARVNRESVDA